jgi:PAS domain S-box-containing protein
MNNTLMAGMSGGSEQACFSWLDAVEQPVFICQEDKFIFVNKAFEKLSALASEALLGKSYLDMIYPDDRPRVKALGVEQPVADCRLVLDKGGAANKRVSLAAKTMLSGEVPVTVFTLNDVSELKLVNAQLNYLRQITTQLNESNPVPSFIIGADHKVMYWNRACAEITGVAASEMVGTNQQWRAFYPEERAVMADLVLSGAMEDNFDSLYSGKFRRSPLIKDAFEAEDFFPHFGETGRWLYFTAAPIFDAKGQRIGAVETLQDVTARHLAEQTLRDHQVKLEEQVIERSSQLDQANEQLMQSEKLASIGQLAAGVAHEINNPIGYVHSNIGTLQNYIDDLFGMLDLYQQAEPLISSAEQAAAVKNMRQQIDLEFLKEDIPMLMNESREGITRVKKIVQDLKDFSHVDSTLEWQWANLHHGIDSTLNVVNNEIKYKADVVKEYGELPDIECLPSQLNQVFMNLMVNAAHAMGDERGRITVRTGCAGDSVWLEFADNGSGIPEAIQAKIFDPFFTTKPVGKGTGLGLSLSYGIIQKHGGTIEVKSKQGEGTVFRIVLPIKHVEVETETAS